MYSLAILSSIHHFDSFFFFNDTATTEIYTLSLHDALPIYGIGTSDHADGKSFRPAVRTGKRVAEWSAERVYEILRSEEHTSELQSRQYLVCRLLLEKKKKKKQKKK